MSINYLFLETNGKYLKLVEARIRQQLIMKVFANYPAALSQRLFGSYIECNLYGWTMYFCIARHNLHIVREI